MRTRCQRAIIPLGGWRLVGDHDTGGRPPADVAASSIPAERPSGGREPIARRRELVTELVSRHLVVTCYRVLSDLLPTCNPRFWPKSAS